tara:strand:+ start:5778 stop:6398 length:621 start_codon:yes stop_codon:yes gene_type:complete
LITALLEGLSMGLLLSALIGPVFFTLIQSSLEHGFRYAALAALGILVSDCIYVLVTYFGVSYLSGIDHFEFVLGVFGGLVLFGFGISNLMKAKTSRPNSGGITLPIQKKTAFLKGFSINGINPFVLLFWVSIASLVHLKPDYGKAEAGIYYSGILGTVFSIDLLKAYVAKKLRPLVTPRLMKILGFLVGLIMIGFGTRMIYWALNQ